ncbi:MAG: glycosyltransferase family 4 protein [Promethearchaeota archaeon]
MNICFLASNILYKAPHAGYSHTINVCRNLQKMGNKVIVIFKGEDEKTFVENGLIIILVVNWDHEGSFSLASLLKTPKAIFKLVRICRRFNIELIHERSGLPRGIGVISAKILGIKSVVELNDPYLDELEVNFKIFFRMFRIMMLKLTGAVVTQTPLLKHMISRDIMAEKIKIIPNGADETVFNEHVEKEHVMKKFGFDGSDVIVVFVGAFRPWHGVEKIVELGEEAISAYPRVKFLVVGSGPLFPQVDQEIKKKGLENKIILTGAVPHDQIPAHIAVADIAIAPFNLDKYGVLKKHGFWWCPVKIFEYMAMGKPVVTFDVGMIKHIVPNGVAGLLSPVQDFTSLLNNIKTLVENRVLRDEMGKNGRNRLLKKFTWKKIGTRIYNLYKDLS